MNKNAFTRKCWSWPDGEQPIVPKDDGTGLMVSALQSCEFGIGFQKLTDIEVTEINNKMCRGKRYFDEEAARKVKGSPVKDPLTIHFNPLITYFEYGANKEGYWSYEHLIVQPEDCLDILKVLYSPEKYEFNILVDHSCGHDIQQLDGLNVKQMNCGYGGKQRIIHNTEMIDGCLGKFDPILKVGDVQHMNFAKDDNGPFYMPPNTRIQLKGGNLVGFTFRMSFELRELKPCTVSLSKIEQMKQNVRTHRSAVDFDAAFCKVSIKHKSVERATSKGTIV